MARASHIFLISSARSKDPSDLPFSFSNRAAAQASSRRAFSQILGVAESTVGSLLWNTISKSVSIAPSVSPSTISSEYT